MLGLISHSSQGKQPQGLEYQGGRALVVLSLLDATWLAREEALVAGEPRQKDTHPMNQATVCAQKRSVNRSTPRDKPILAIAMSGGWQTYTGGSGQLSEDVASEACLPVEEAPLLLDLGELGGEVVEVECNVLDETERLLIWWQRWWKQRRAVWCRVKRWWIAWVLGKEGKKHPRQKGWRAGCSSVGLKVGKLESGLAGDEGHKSVLGLVWGAASCCTYYVQHTLSRASLCFSRPCADVLMRHWQGSRSGLKWFKVLAH